MYTRLYFPSLLIVSILSANLQAAGTDRHSANQSLALGLPNRTHLNINNISTMFWNDGSSDIDSTGNGRFVFPKGSFRTAVFESGFLWGTKVSGEKRVGGSAYRTGLQGGKILSPGIAEDPNLPKNRIYRVRPDYLTADLSVEVVEEGGSASLIRARYALDWNEWPVPDGAPFIDANANGTYEPAVDTPGVPGANQTIWFVCNDLNSALTTNLYGSLPIGMEMQVTIWAYALTGAGGNMLFKSYLLINKSTTPFDSLYLTQWSDPDIGDSNNDFAGCDTLLMLSYAYNASDTDPSYDPLPPPAAGFALMQGPIVPSPGSTAIFRRHVVHGYRNLPMTAHYYYTRGDTVLADPPLGSYTGTIHFYNYMQGRIGSTGAVYTDPNGRQTRFALDGNPVAGTGWIDGQLVPAGDRRDGISMGPLTMAQGDTQEVVLAEMAAGAVVGVSRLQAVQLLKSQVNTARALYYSLITVSAPEEVQPFAFRLEQNYPNPFNPSTTIRFALPEASSVSLEVYNVLGQRVRTLVKDESYQPGNWSVKWDGVNDAGVVLPTGTYFSRLTAPGGVFTKKMVMVK